MYAGAGENLPDDLDVLFLEPADPRALAAAQVLRMRDERLPITCVSIYPEAPDSHRLGPLAYLLKPFPCAELERAVAAAVEPVSLAG